MIGRGILPEPVAARLLIAAGLIDLLTVFLATKMLAPVLQDEFPLLRTDYAQIAIFVLLLLLFWLACDLLLAGYSPGRLAMGLEMASKGGGHLPLMRRSMRLGGKLATLGLSGLRIGQLAGYDRVAGTVWLSAMSRIPARPPAEWRLRFLNGPHAGRSIALGRIPGFADQQAIRIGRDRDWANMALNNSRLSGRHCILRVQGNGLEIRDGSGAGQSANGTYLQERRIPGDRWTAVEPGQMIRAGETRLVLTA